ncbi:MAG: hypothetical protein AUK47_23310 [Deltaproteobacteria bacterium CG2_30_63_29]|nr:MAG: hypothetical protein AUK47_23310 [Deltaproteobacteria bacterium CG2_30_63_29]PJB36934.1 MAG: hypothetical protein CO108_22185 [Deltaproteobacteria bacterium CG_4_9_14_3_um_filter_63_12]
MALSSETGKVEEELLLTLALWAESGAGDSLLRRCLGSLARLWDGEAQRSKLLDGVSLRQRRVLLSFCEHPRSVVEAKGAQVHKQLRTLGARPLVLGTAEYPESLASIMDPPPVLSALGNTALLRAATVAMVGTRSPDGLATRACSEIVERLVTEGQLVTVSGGAVGVDAVVHASTLEHGGGTVWIAGTGLDRVYPSRNAQLFERVAANGLVVSQFSPGTPAHRRQFPRRNFTIAALARVVIVVQASTSSGTLYTVEGARRYARPLYVLSPLAFDRGWAGGVDLLRTGAARPLYGVEELTEISRLCGAKPAPRPASKTRSLFGEPASRPDSMLDENARRVVEQLARRPLHQDQFSNEIINVDATLLELELQGIIERCPGGAIRLSR